MHTRAWVSTCRFRRRQTGLATVLVSLVLLLASTLIVFFLARSTVVEQRITGNEVRAKQALTAAEAGLDRALLYVQENGLDADGIGGTDDISEPKDVGGGSSPAQYQVAFCEADDPGFNTAGGGQCPQAVGATAFACNTPSHLARKVMLVACGWSDDESARHFASRLVAFSPALANAPTNPLTSKGVVNVSGNMNVMNYYDNLTIWTGDTVDFNNATSKTFVRDPADEVPDLPDFDNPESLESYAPVPDSYLDPDGASQPKNSDSYVSGLEKEVMSVDIVSSDNNLVTSDLFSNYFGETQDVYRETVVTQDIAGDEVGTINHEGQVVWAEGDVVINDDIGTREKPVVLIVNGDVTFKGNSKFHGIVFSTETVGGETKASGTPQILGAVISAGTVDATGNLEIYYDPLAAGIAARSGAPATVPGTWHDWPR